MVAASSPASTMVGDSGGGVAPAAGLPELLEAPGVLPPTKVGKSSGRRGPWSSMDCAALPSKAAIQENKERASQAVKILARIRKYGKYITQLPASQGFASVGSVLDLVFSANSAEASLRSLRLESLDSLEIKAQKCFKRRVRREKPQRSQRKSSAN